MANGEDQAAGSNPTESPAANLKSSASSSITEFEPPLACVRRMLKNTLPSSTNVGKDAASAFSRACGIFVIYLTACANDFARENKRQTITANDILAAVKELDFGEFVPKLSNFIQQHRDSEKKKKESKVYGKHERDDHSQGDDTDEVETPTSKRRKGSENASDDGHGDDLEVSISVDDYAYDESVVDEDDATQDEEDDIDEDVSLAEDSQNGYDDVEGDESVGEGNHVDEGEHIQ